MGLLFFRTPRGRSRAGAIRSPPRRIRMVLAQFRPPPSSERGKIMNPEIDLSKQRVAYEDEAVKEALDRILSNKYKRDVRITNFVREDLRNTHRGVVSRLYLLLDFFDETTVIVKQFHPDWLDNGEDFIVAQEALGRALSGKRIAPELYGTVRDVEKRRYWLFMEDLGKNLVCGREDFENEAMKHCLGFVEKLAKIHLLFADKEEELGQVLRPLVMPPRSHAGWRNRYESAIEKVPDYIEKIVQTGKFPWLAEMATPFTAILEPCLSIIDRLVSQPFVFSYWDMAPEENMVIGCEGEDPIYYFIDWDEVYFGPALDNLGGLIWYERGESEELALVEKYWECVRGSPLVPSEKEECLVMYKYYRLMGAIHSIHFHAERSIERHLPVSEGAIRRAIPVAIKLAKELRMM